jgi:hypothetical protein
MQPARGIAKRRRKRIGDMTRSRATMVGDRDRVTDSGRLRRRAPEREEGSAALERETGPKGAAGG